MHITSLPGIASTLFTVHRVHCRTYSHLLYSVFPALYPLYSRSIVCTVALFPLIIFSLPVIASTQFTVHRAHNRTYSHLLSSVFPSLYPLYSPSIVRTIAPIPTYYIQSSRHCIHSIHGPSCAQSHLFPLTIFSLPVIASIQFTVHRAHNRTYSHLLSSVFLALHPLYSRSIVHHSPDW